MPPTFEGLATGFLQVRENWKRSGNLSGQGKSGKVRENAKMTGKSGKFWGKFYLFVQLL